MDHVVPKDLRGELSEEKHSKNYSRGTKGRHALFLMAASTLLSLLNPAVNTCDGLDAICCSCSLLNFLPIPKEKISTPFCFKLLAGTRTLSCEMPSVMITRTGFLPVLLPRPNKYLERISTYRGQNCIEELNLPFLASLLKVLFKPYSAVTCCHYKGLHQSPEQVFQVRDKTSTRLTPYKSIINKLLH